MKACTLFHLQYILALAELYLLNQDLDACQSQLQTILKNNKDCDRATLVRLIYTHLRGRKILRGEFVKSFSKGRKFKILSEKIILKSL